LAGKRAGQGRAARRKAQLDRLAAGTADGGDARRARARDAAEQAAAVGPSAARWLTGTAAIDVVADLLSLDPRTSLRGRGGDHLRALAGAVVDLIGVDAVAPSGRSLVDVVTDDDELRSALRPSLDLEAVLAGGPVPGDRADRTVRVAEALLDRASAHREGRTDLYRDVAPIGHERHALADEVEATVRVALEGLDVPAGAEPAVVAVTGGWVAVDRVELFLAAGRRLLSGRAADLGGAALAAWFGEVERDPTGGRWMALAARFPIEAEPLLREASARAGSDHPDVVGAALVDLIGTRYPIAAPG
jgi:hypothetical protein